MNIPLLLQIAFGAVLVNNFILARVLGLHTAISFSTSVPCAAGTGAVIAFIMTAGAACTWIVNTLILVPRELASIQLIVFIVIITIVVQLTEVALQKFSPKFHNFLGMNLTLITTDCALLAAALIATQVNPLTGHSFGFAEACVLGAGSGLGFAVVIVLMAAIREKLDLAHGWNSLRGLPQALIVAGLMAMAFLGFTGIHRAAGGG
jgi:electron transport complex protein RnfA